MFKTSDNFCLAKDGSKLFEEPIELNEGNQYFKSNQILIVKKSLTGGYVVYNLPTDSENTNNAICETSNGSLSFAKCSSVTNLYFCWNFVKVNNYQFA